MLGPSRAIIKLNRDFSLVKPNSGKAQDKLGPAGVAQARLVGNPIHREAC